MNGFNRKYFWILIVGILGCFPSGATYAQVASGELLVGESAVESTEAMNVPNVHLSELLDEALAKNPDILAAESRWLASKKKIMQSWALPDPVVGMDVMGEETETRVGSQENRLTLSQKIPFPWKLWERRGAAKIQR